MSNLVFTFIFLTISWTSSAYDQFQGLGAQNRPCFGVVNTFDSGNCDPDNSISKVFSPSYKGVNTNPPDTQFYLFSAKNPNEAELLHKCGGRLPSNTNFNRSHDTVVICHGYLDGVCRTSWMRELKHQFMERGGYNVILVDWTWGNFPDDAGAGANSLVTGETIGFVIINIMMDQKLNGSQFYFVGHSYGSYVINSGAKFIYNNNRELKIRRMTYLDPAGAPFPNDDPKILLNRKYASFADAIHSGSGTCVPFRFGTIEAVTDADFYPNGGSENPSCYSYVPTSIAKGDIFYGFASILPVFCYHLQSIQFYKVSINKPDKLPYIGVMCDNYEAFQNGSCTRCCAENPSQCAVAGLEAEKYPRPSRIRGKYRKYYYNTEHECPYPEDYAFSILKDCPSQ